MIVILHNCKCDIETLLQILRQPFDILRVNVVELEMLDTYDISYFLFDGSLIKIVIWVGLGNIMLLIE